MTGFAALLAVLPAALGLALAVWVLTWAVRRVLERLSLFDRPNQRSSHVTPKPRGAGLALIPLLVIAWIIWSAARGPTPDSLRLVMAGALLLGVVSWVDDVRGLSAGLRLAVQAAAVALGVVGLDDQDLVFQGLLPPLADHLAAGLLWLWFVNLFNFMDGIDGISGVEAVTVALGLSLCLALLGAAPDLAGLALLLAAATLGFLPWNWAPSKIFLGDVGSVPLGYLLAWLLLAAAAQGQWAAALILPLYYLADATLTLVKRGLRGERVWHAHKEHAYQRAVQGGLSHDAVALRVLAGNLALMALAALAAAGWPWLALIAAGLVVAALLAALERQARKRS